MWPSKLWWIMRLALWLGVLPIRLRMHSLPSLLERLTPAGRSTGGAPLQMERVVRVAVQLCHLRLFHTRFFPQPCLRQALALYYVLTQLGYPVVIHFGILKKGGVLIGHSWVTVAGQPVAEDIHTRIFHIVYSYPTASYHGK